MSTLQVSRLESLIVDRICSLDYVARAAYGDDGGEEVTVLVFHDYVPARFEEMFMEIVHRGIEIEREMPDRLITAIPIHDGPDLSDDTLFGCNLIYTRGDRR